MDHQVTYDLATGFDPFHRIRVDTSALAGAAEHDLDAAVAGCPGWTVADLAWHVLEVQFFWATVVADRLQDPAGYTEPPRPADPDLAPALRDGVEHLLDVLRAADPGEPVFTWASRQDAGWVVRHQVQEAAVHRWDAETAIGLDVPLDAAGATDGIEEFLRYSTPFRAEGAALAGGSLVLAAVDTGFRWSVVEDDGGVVRWRRLGGSDPADASAVVSGSASDLLLYLYRRRRVGAFVVEGDVGVVERFALRNPTG